MLLEEQQPRGASAGPSAQPKRLPMDRPPLGSADLLTSSTLVKQGIRRQGALTPPGLKATGSVRWFRMKSMRMLRKERKHGERTTPGEWAAGRRSDVMPKQLQDVSFPLRRTAAIASVVSAPKPIRETKSSLLVYAALIRGGDGLTARQILENDDALPRGTIHGLLGKMIRARILTVDDEAIPPVYAFTPGGYLYALEQLETFHFTTAELLTADRRWGSGPRPAV